VKPIVRVLSYLPRQVYEACMDAFAPLAWSRRYFTAQLSSVSSPGRRALLLRHLLNIETRARNWSAGERLAREVLSLFPDDAWMTVELATILEHLGKKREARTYLLGLASNDRIAPAFRERAASEAKRLGGEDSSA